MNQLIREALKRAETVGQKEIDRVVGRIEEIGEILGDDDEVAMVSFAAAFMHLTDKLDVDPTEVVRGVQAYFDVVEAGNEYVA